MQDEQMNQPYEKPHLDIVARCIEGDRSAQYELYQLYAKAMLNTAYRIVNDRDDAEDILQDAFISAFRNLASYQGTATIGAWLKRIVVNKSINFLKKKRPEGLSIEELPPGQAEHNSYAASGPDEPDWSITQIREAVQQLPEGFRTVFSLYLLEGYDHSEIAGILSISESTSKSQLNRAKKKVRELLNELYIHE